MAVGSNFVLAGIHHCIATNFIVRRSFSNNCICSISLKKKMSVKIVVGHCPLAHAVPTAMCITAMAIPALYVVCSDPSPCSWRDWAIILL